MYKHIINGLVLRAFISRLIYKSFDTTFMGNIKSSQKIIYLFFFSNRKFLTIFSKPMLLRFQLTFPYYKTRGLSFLKQTYVYKFIYIHYKIQKELLSKKIKKIK